MSSCANIPPLGPKGKIMNRSDLSPKELKTYFQIKIEAHNKGVKDELGLEAMLGATSIMLWFMYLVFVGGIALAIVAIMQGLEDVSGLTLLYGLIALGLVWFSASQVHTLKNVIPKVMKVIVNEGLGK